jgi:AcrR family transcriptional regulator
MAMVRASPRAPTEIRRLILASARELFATRGYAGTSTREVARHAGVASSQLFAHFGNKARLFDASVTAAYADVVTGYVERWESVSHDDVETSELCREIIGELFELFVKHRGLLSALVLAREHEPELADELAQGDDAVQRALTPLERFTAAEAGRRGYPSSESVVAVRLTHGTVLAATLFGVFDDRAGGPPSKEFADLITYGLEHNAGPRPNGVLPRLPSVAEPIAMSDTQQRLVDIARDLFCRHGYTNTGTRALAAATGTSESAMFRHFADKQTLFDRAVTETWLARLTDALVAHDSDPRARDRRSYLAVEVRWLAQLLSGGRGLILGTLETCRVSAKSTAAIDQTVRLVVEMLERRLPGDWRPGRVYLTLLVCMVMGATVLDRWLFAGHDGEAQAAVDNITALSGDGFAHPVSATD